MKPGRSGPQRRARPAPIELVPYARMLRAIALRDAVRRLFARRASPMVEEDLPPRDILL